MTPGERGINADCSRTRTDVEYSLSYERQFRSLLDENLCAVEIERIENLRMSL
jgi:hypothetical protein